MSGRLCHYCFGTGKILEDGGRANAPPSEFDITVMQERDAYRIALQFVVDGYANHDVGHLDYRVKVYQVALAALSAISRSSNDNHAIVGDIRPTKNYPAGTKLSDITEFEVWDGIRWVNRSQVYHI